MLWSSRRRTVTCGCCAGRDASHPATRPVADGWTTAGGAAFREYHRRRTRRAGGLRQRFGRPGALFATFTEPMHQRAWARGARGERRVAQRLGARLAGTGVLLLHDRRLPHGRANLDHIAIGPAGVIVIDAKNLRGRVRRERRAASERLRVGDHDRTSLVVSAQRQAASVARVLEEAGFDHIPVRGALCLARPQSLLLHASTTVRGVPVGSPERVARHARRRGGLSPERVAELAVWLSARLPRA